MATGIAAIGSWLGSLTAAQVAAGATVIAAGATAAQAMKSPDTPQAGSTLMPTKDVEKKDKEEDISLGSDRGAERRGRQSGRATLMAPRTGAAAPNTPASGVKL